MTMPAFGATATEKLDAAVMVSATVEVALCVPTVTVSGPVAAPAGMTKAMLVAVKLVIGAEIVPPPCWFKVTVGPPPLGVVKLVPVTLTGVPTGPDCGMKLLMVGPVLVIVAVLVAVLLLPWPSLTVSDTVNIPAALYTCVGMGPLPVEPSPKVQVNVRTSRSGSLDFEPSKVMVCPVVPL